MSPQKDTLGWISLWTAIAGAVLPFALTIFVHSLQRYLWFTGPFIIWGLELVAFVIGVIARRTTPGKIGMGVAVIISLFLIGYLSIGSTTITREP